MSAPLNEIVNVTISRESVNISRVGFGTMLILGGNAAFPERLRYYSDLPSLADDMQGGTSAPEYLAALAAFSANPKVTRVAVGHRGATVVVTENAGTFTAGSISAIVNGVPITRAWATSKAATMTAFAADIAAVAGIASAISAPPIITITPSAGAVVGLTIDTSSVTGTMVITSIATTESEAADTALDAIESYNNDWYAIVCTSRNTTDVGKVAAWTEAQELKFFATASADPNIIGQSVQADTTSIAAIFKNYDSTFVLCLCRILSKT